MKMRQARRRITKNMAYWCEHRYKVLTKRYFKTRSHKAFLDCIEFFGAYMKRHCPMIKMIEEDMKTHGITNDDLAEENRQWNEVMEQERKEMRGGNS